MNISVLLTERFQFAPRRALKQLAGDDRSYYEVLDRAEQAGLPVGSPAGAAPVLPRRLERLAAMFPEQQASLELFYPDLTGVGG